MSKRNRDRAMTDTEAATAEGMPSMPSEEVAPEVSSKPPTPAEIEAELARRRTEAASAHAAMLGNELSKIDARLAALGDPKAEKDKELAKITAIREQAAEVRKGLDEEDSAVWGAFEKRNRDDWSPRRTEQIGLTERRKVLAAQLNG